MGAHKSKQYFDQQGNLNIKPYRLKDLIAIFDVNENTFKKWMARYPEQLGEKDGKYYSIRQVEFMIEKFGLPKKVYIMQVPFSKAA
ncbi:hypothetical protein [Longitalea luteola]|uniref:hypothetical protein n=1 Tax=Longitalea luteola TaxID=2812563 RepID=UPI001A97650A|nr:hypothetical protein [Longitalea luteola]